jgi:hypothetical protein
VRTLGRPVPLRRRAAGGEHGGEREHEDGPTATHEA